MRPLLEGVDGDDAVFAHPAEGLDLRPGGAKLRPAEGLQLAGPAVQRQGGTKDAIADADRQLHRAATLVQPGVVRRHAVHDDPPEGGVRRPEVGLVVLRAAERQLGESVLLEHALERRDSLEHDRCVVDVDARLNVHRGHVAIDEAEVGQLGQPARELRDRGLLAA